MDDHDPIAAEAVGLLDRLNPDTPTLHVTDGERRAEELARFLAAVLPDRQVLCLPPWDCLPFDSASPTPAAMGRRMAVLHRMKDAAPGTVAVMTVQSLLQRLPPESAIRSFPIRAGQPLDLPALRDFCSGAGYEEDERIDEPGEVAFHGTTVEIFPGGDRLPCRIELSDQGVTAIRRFDPVTQRSLSEVEVLDLFPVTELPPDVETRDRGAEHRLPRHYPRLTTVADHLPGAHLSMAPSVPAAGRVLLDRIAEAQADAAEGGAEPLAADALYLDRDAWAALVDGATLLPEPEGQPVPAFAAERRPRNRLSRFLDDQAGAKRRLLFTAHSPAEGKRLQRMLRQAGGAEPAPLASWSEARESGSALLVADLGRGFVTGDLAVVTAADLLGSRAQQPDDLSVFQSPWQVQATGIQIGDVVVHEDHGLARLDGIESLDGDEAIRLVFANDERLLVPAHEAGGIWRYGSADAGVTLDRLRGTAWRKRRDATRKALDQLAEQLVALARERSQASAPKLVPPGRDFERFVARFPFPATPDQLAATREALGDMASGHPMDRLVVGDVGFGKTEIALRAAAAAALAGRQVAIAAPTTVLARQHVETFRKRFAPFGIQVGHLSRLVTGKAAAEVKAGLADGSIRIVVGTHALVGKGVAFADLGLLVIDEEQRFGTAQKQKLRALGSGCHVLSMTATPIPRTLQGALVGLQDLSVIRTPPARRRPIRTLIGGDDDATLRQALRRERRRGGQSFVVVPRIEDIEPVADRLRQLLPDFALRIAHGELPAKQIDATMVAFAQGDGDILLATAIIESGLDVSRANTMLVIRPALFGLAQLHQLRGRVGRGAVQAYCYLLNREDEELSEDALKRLGTLQALDRLGAGMAISAADLDRRGAGDLLGDRQAGHVERVGLGLYQEMLAAALRHARGEDTPPPAPQIVGAPGLIPQDHVAEPETRIDLYHRLARATLPEEVEALDAEIADRFGPPPPPLTMLLKAAVLRSLAGTLGVEKVTMGPDGIALDFHKGADLAEFEAAAGKLDLESPSRHRLLLRREFDDDDERLLTAIDLLERLT
ncbi:DEAD/DEAH box helicase [Paracoccus beibuensis]|uniref:DEAD/DEAH box helicase n=1 Tax=Paracoccus beibuensis TaxID=547602 RepID=UPI00223EAEB4|nr:DEAD/DEAH box helicase [Paracoccus beibuensis]